MILGFKAKMDYLELIRDGVNKKIALNHAHKIQKYINEYPKLYNWIPNYKHKHNIIVSYFPKNSDILIMKNFNKKLPVQNGNYKIINWIKNG